MQRNVKGLEWEAELEDRKVQSPGLLKIQDLPRKSVQRCVLRRQQLLVRFEREGGKVELKMIMTEK